ncbi:unnamed protein product [Rotaria sp. Silwood1]|nr:unnamed protein product [Rotaria sp. Silwood1]
MSIAVIKFYCIHLLQSNVFKYIISLCVSDTLLIDNGLWLALHLSIFINLHHLFLSNISLIMFGVHFSIYYRDAYTFEGVPDGAYYERIFDLFPLLCPCHHRSPQCIQKTLDSRMVLPVNKAFMQIETRFLNLQSIVLRECSLIFLLHLLKYHSQLQELSFSLSNPWLPDKHSLMNGNQK